MYALSGTQGNRAAFPRDMALSQKQSARSDRGRIISIWPTCSNSGQLRRAGPISKPHEAAEACVETVRGYLLPLPPFSQLLSPEAS